MLSLSSTLVSILNWNFHLNLNYNRSSRNRYKDILHPIFTPCLEQTDTMVNNAIFSYKYSANS